MIFRIFDLINTQKSQICDINQRLLYEATNLYLFEKWMEIVCQ